MTERAPGGRPWSLSHDAALLRIEREPSDWGPVARALGRSAIVVRARWAGLGGLARERQRRNNLRRVVNHHRYLTPEQRDEMVDLRRSGEKLVYLAALYGVSDNTVTRVMRRAGL